MKKWALAAAVAALLSAIVFGGYQCPILSLTGIPCPGCGMTRAARCLFRLDFSGAFSYHPMIYLLIPAALAACYGAAKKKPGSWHLFYLVPLGAIWILWYAVHLVQIFS